MTEQLSEACVEGAVGPCHRYDIPPIQICLQHHSSQVQSSVLAEYSKCGGRVNTATISYLSAVLSNSRSSGAALGVSPGHAKGPV